MRPGRMLTVVAVLGLGVALVAGCSSGSSNKSSKKGGAGGVTAPSGGTGTPVAVDVGDTTGTAGPMTLTVVPASVAAGKVTFTVKNSGTITHEMVVLKTDTPFDQLTVNAAEGKVDEATSAGETGDVEAGKTKAVTLDLTAAKYVLVCNIKDHYKMGMRASFTVT